MEFNEIRILEKTRFSKDYSPELSVRTLNERPETLLSGATLSKAILQASGSAGEYPSTISPRRRSLDFDSV